jgi:hypothetical protein
MEYSNHYRDPKLPNKNINSLSLNPKFVNQNFCHPESVEGRN